MSAVLSSVKRPLFWPLYLSEMSVPSDTSNIAVSPTMSMTASIFTLICISIIFYEIFKYTDGALHQPDVASSMGCGLSWCGGLVLESLFLDNVLYAYLGMHRHIVT